MLDPQNLLEIISGRQKGLGSSLIRGCLSCLTPVYRAVVGFRNRKFDRAIANGDTATVRRADVPVISVGNLTTGGTGKTPLVIWIAQWLRNRNLRVALISRGYGSSEGPNDEAREIEQRLLDVPHLQDPDRFKMAEIATEELETQMIVLDDGFQHRQLHRDLDIVLIDATCPFGYGRLLPRGLLREPVSGLRRASVVVITRCNLITPEKKQQLRRRIEQTIDQVPIVETQTVMTKLLQSSGRESDLNEIRDKPIFLFSAIGNPSGFRSSIEQDSFNVTDSMNFPDHHEFSRDDISRIGNAAKDSKAAVIVCTHKDLVKIGVDAIEGIPVHAVLIEIEFLSGLEKLKEAIEAVAEQCFDGS